MVPREGFLVEGNPDVDQGVDVDEWLAQVDFLVERPDFTTISALRRVLRSLSSQVTLTMEAVFAIPSATSRWSQEAVVEML